MSKSLMTPTHKWIPVVDKDKCTGCELCANACGPKCLEMQGALAVLTIPDVCGSEEHCIGLCADDAIQMAWLPWKGDTSRGKWQSFSDAIPFVSNVDVNAML